MPREGIGGTITASILAANFARLGEQVGEAGRAGADRIHVDMMDGHFVRNISMGDLIVASLRPALPKTRIVRQMIERFHPGCHLEADEDIDPETASIAVEAGSDLLVAGTAVFGDSRRGDGGNGDGQAFGLNARTAC